MQYLPPAMGYVHGQLNLLGPARAVVFTAEAMQPERFPFEPVYVSAAAQLPHDVPSRSPVLVPPFHLQWEQLLHDEGVGLLHAHDGRAGLLFLPLARRAGIPLVTTCLGRDVTESWQDPTRANALRELFAEGDLFTVMSCRMAALLEKLGCPVSKIRVIRRGIPLATFPFSPRRAPYDEPSVVLTRGRPTSICASLAMAKAFALVRCSGLDAVLHVIGEPDSLPEQTAAFADAGVTESVRFLGHLEGEGLAEAMRRAHVFCLPVGPEDDWEAIPNSLMRAMATGLPVISTLHGGVPELVNDGESGFLVPDNDPETLADRLAWLLETPERWETMGRAGRRKVEAEFALDRIVQQLVEEAYSPPIRPVRTLDWQVASRKGGKGYPPVAHTRPGAASATIVPVRPLPVALPRTVRTCSRFPAGSPPPTFSSGPPSRWWDRPR